MADALANALAAANDAAVAVDVRVDNLSRSYYAFKGSLTNRINAATRCIAINRGQDVSDHKMQSLAACLDNLDDAMSKISDVIVVLMQLDAADGRLEHWQNELDTEQTRKDNAAGQVITELARGQAQRARAQAAAPVAPGANQANAQQGDRPKAITDLRPTTLTQSATPEELTAWIKDFRTYFRASHFNVADLEAQQGHFRRCLHPKLLLRISPKIEDNTPVLEDGLAAGVRSCVSILRDEFLESYPLFTRRLKFFQYVQPQGVQWTTFARQMQRLGHEADLENLSVEETYCMRYLCATSNPELLEEFFQLEDINKDSVEECALRYEAKEIAKTSLSKAGKGVAKVNAAYHKSSRDDASAEERNLVRQTVFNELLQKGLCVRCADPGHKGPDCPFVRSDTVCNSCGMKGHIAKACIRAKIRRKKQEPRRSDEQKKKSNKKTSSYGDKRKKSSYKKQKAQAKRAEAGASDESESSEETSSEAGSEGSEAATNTVRVQAASAKDNPKRVAQHPVGADNRDSARDREGRGRAIRRTRVCFTEEGEIRQAPSDKSEQE